MSNLQGEMQKRYSQSIRSRGGSRLETRNPESIQMKERLEIQNLYIERCV